TPGGDLGVGAHHRPRSLLALAPAENSQLEIVELADRGLFGDVHRLHVPRARAAHELAGLVELASLRALKLAARRLRKRAGRQRNHVVQGQPHPLLHGASNLGDEATGLAHALWLLDFEGEHDALAIALDAARIPGPERNHVAPADAGDPARLPLHVLGVIVAAVDDHELLAPPAHEHVTALQKTEVAGLEKTSRKRVPSSFGIFPVPAHQAGPSDTELADDALGERSLARGVVGIEYADRVLGELAPARDEAHGAFV